MSKIEKQLYEFDHFRLDVGERLLLRDGQAIPLPPKVFDMLVVLVSRSGRLIEKDELMQGVWPGSFVEEGNLSVNVSALRKALGDNQNGQRYIQTVPKRGYRFVPSVREIWPEEDDLLLVRRTSTSISIKEEEEETEQTNPEALAKPDTGRTASSFKIIAAWVLLVALVTLSFIWISVKK